MLTAKAAKRMYRETCTMRVGRTTDDGLLVVERVRKPNKPSFKVWLRAEFKNWSGPASHKVLRMIGGV